MIHSAIHSPNVPAAIGPFSQGVKAGKTLYISGQLPIDPSTGKFSGTDISSQTRQSLINIRNVLKEAGADMSNVVKTTVFLANIADFSAMNDVYAQFFSAPYPARAAFQVACLPKEALVEIECIAVCD